MYCKRGGVFGEKAPHLLSLKGKGSQLRTLAYPAYLPGCQEGEAPGSYQPPNHSLRQWWEAGFERNSWCDWQGQPLQACSPSHSASLRSGGGYPRAAQEYGRCVEQRQDPLDREREGGRISLTSPHLERGRALQPRYR